MPAGPRKLLCNRPEAAQKPGSSARSRMPAGSAARSRSSASRLRRTACDGGGGWWWGRAWVRWSEGHLKGSCAATHAAQSAAAQGEGRRAVRWGGVQRVAGSPRAQGRASALAGRRSTGALHTHTRGTAGCPPHLILAHNEDLVEVRVQRGDEGLSRRQEGGHRHAGGDLRRRQERGQKGCLKYYVQVWISNLSSIGTLALDSVRAITGNCSCG